MKKFTVMEVNPGDWDVLDGSRDNFRVYAVRKTDSGCVVSSYTGMSHEYTMPSKDVVHSLMEGLL